MLREGDPKVDCVVLSRSPDDDVADSGPARRVALFKREPCVVAVNGVSVVGKKYPEVKTLIEQATRPLVLRCQIGTVPAVPCHIPVVTPSLHLRTRSHELAVAQTRSESVQQASDGAGDETVSRIASTEGHSLSLTFPDTDPLVSPAIVSPSDEQGSLHRYYRCLTPAVTPGVTPGVTPTVSATPTEGHKKQASPEELELKSADFVESVRIQFMLELCSLIGQYKRHFRNRACLGSDG